MKRIGLGPWRKFVASPWASRKLDMGSFSKGMHKAVYKRGQLALGLLAQLA
jgi:hypothetical protein